MVVEQLLRPEALQQLLTFLSESTIYHASLLGGRQLAASLAEGDGDPRQMDFFAGETVVDGYDGRWAAPWARLLGHPRLGGYLRELCGEGHRLDVAPALLPEVAPLPEAVAATALHDTELQKMLVRRPSLGAPCNCGASLASPSFC